MLLPVILPDSLPDIFLVTLAIIFSNTLPDAFKSSTGWKALQSEMQRQNRLVHFEFTFTSAEGRAVQRSENLKLTLCAKGERCAANALLFKVMQSQNVFLN